MPHNRFFRAWSFGLLALVVCFCDQTWGLEAGAAKVEITPPLGSPLNGYADRIGRGSLSVHDPLWARCLYLSDGTNATFLVSADLCTITRELRTRVLELAPPEIKPETIILTATHTRNAQGGMMRSLVFRFISGRYVPELVDQAAHGITEAMRLAYEGRKRGAIGFSVYDPNESAPKPRETTGPVEPQIGLIRVDDADGNPISVIANVAGHPMLLGEADRYAISADYPGYFCKALEDAFGSGCVPMFLNGATGNQRSKDLDGKTSWDLAETAGRTLAEKAHPLLLQTKCADLKLHVGYATPALPLSTAATVLPTSTVMHTLEIGDLLLAFVPGETCVEIGLELRTRAQQRGYANAFTVGLADEYVGYFVPQIYYGQDNYETRMSFYGPRMTDWVYAEAGKLMTKGASDPVVAPPVAAIVDTLNAEDGTRIKHVLLKGSPRTIGFKRGAAFKDLLAARFKEDFVQRLESGAILPEKGLWRTLSGYLDVTPITLRMLCLGARPLLQNLSPPVFEEIDGLAEGAQLPFDAAWLLQCAPTFAAQPNMNGFYADPYCTMFAMVGDRAGVDEILVGRNLDWENGNDEPVVVEVSPETGHRFAQVGFAWNVGAFTGMNDAGLVLCAERVPGHGVPPGNRTPIELILRDLLQSCNDVDAAVAQLHTQTDLSGYNVLVAGPSGGYAAVVAFSGTATVRAPASGVLLGTDPAETGLDAEAIARYGRVRDLTSTDHIIPATKIRSILADRQGDLSGTGRIWNEHTKYSVFFEPRSRTLHVAIRNANGLPSGYATLTFENKSEPAPVLVPAHKPTATQKRKASR